MRERKRADYAKYVTSSLKDYAYVINVRTKTNFDMKLPGIRRSSSLWCISVLHKLFVEVFSEFIQFGCDSVDTDKNTETFKSVKLRNS